MFRYLGEIGVPMSDECRRYYAETAPPSVKVGDKETNKDVINDEGKYVHHILKDDDTDTIESKKAFNAALISKCRDAACPQGSSKPAVSSYN